MSAGTEYLNTVPYLCALSLKAEHGPEVIALAGLGVAQELFKGRGRHINAQQNVVSVF